MEVDRAAASREDRAAPLTRLRESSTHRPGGVAPVAWVGAGPVLIGVWTAPGTTLQDELYAVSVDADGLVYAAAQFRDRIYVLRAADAIR